MPSAVARARSSLTLGPTELAEDDGGAVDEPRGSGDSGRATPQPSWIGAGGSGVVAGPGRGRRAQQRQERRGMARSSASKSKCASSESPSAWPDAGSAADRTGAACSCTPWAAGQTSCGAWHTHAGQGGRGGHGGTRKSARCPPIAATPAQAARCMQRARPPSTRKSLRWHACTCTGRLKQDTRANLVRDMHLQNSTTLCFCWYPFWGGH